MLYALVDYSNKRKILDSYFSEEILGEVRVHVPKFTEKNCISNSKKFLRKIKKYNVKNIVLNNELNQNNEFKNILIENKKYIITGSRLAKVLLPRIIEEISNYSKSIKEKLKVVLLMNEYSIENIDLIECISNEVKQLSVVSKNYTKYQKTAEKLFENYGYMIKLYDNKSKVFKRDNIIINIDFTEKEVQSMLLPRNGIIISLNEKINSLKKTFNGIIINDIDISGEGMQNNNFRKLSLCEAKLYRPLRKIKDNERVFFMEKYIINGYIGKNGKITTEEFEKIGKSYT